MKKSHYEELMADAELQRASAVEGLVLDAAELVARLMKQRNVSKAELAKRLGKSRPYVTQLLSGSTNMTIRTLAEVSFALGAVVQLNAVKRRTSFSGR